MRPAGTDFSRKDTTGKIAFVLFTLGLVLSLLGVIVVLYLSVAGATP